ncbi:hypothetical protein BKA25_003906 [Actinoalloteichus hymeniacidonis]|nr:hypothetical protein [Actinoalloteichus hymeniacidonis]
MDGLELMVLLGIAVLAGAVLSPFAHRGAAAAPMDEYAP